MYIYLKRESKLKKKKFKLTLLTLPCMHTNT